MDYTDKKEHNEKTDPFPDPCREKGKNTPAAPQSERRLRLDDSCETDSGSLTVDDSSPVKAKERIYRTQCTIRLKRIADNGNQSETVDQVGRESESLHSDTPAGDVESTNATCCSEVETVQEKADVTISKPAVPSASKEKELESLLEELGLGHHYKEKLSLSRLLRIDKKTITDEPAK